MTLATQLIGKAMPNARAVLKSDGSLALKNTRREGLDNLARLTQIARMAMEFAF